MQYKRNKIGIFIDDVLRNYSDNFEKTYYLYEHELFDEIGFSESMADLEDEDKEQESSLQILNLPFESDPFSFTSKFKFQNEKDFHLFLNNEFAFELNSKCVTLKDRYTDYLLFINEYSQNNELTLINYSSNKAIFSTLLFLSKEQIAFKRLNFYAPSEQIFNHFDVVISPFKHLQMTCPDNKKHILVDEKFKFDKIIL
jgi:hypothetical protein